MTDEIGREQEIAITKRRTSTVIRAGLGLSLAAYLAAGLAMLGTRLGLWGFSTGVAMLRWAVYAGVIMMILAGIELYRSRALGMRHRGVPLAVLVFLAGFILVAIPLRQSRVGADAPPIHDVTTDTENPPAFVAIAARRGNAPNPLTHGGPEVARLQSEAYPDIRPAILDLPRDQAFRRALEIAEQSGWRIVDANEVEGRIEATARTFWLGLQEDVIIRLTPLDGRTVVDVRSMSRARESDRGTNARRVREYLRAIQA